MRVSKQILVMLLLGVIITASCRRESEAVKSNKLPPDQMVEINRELVIKEQERIQGYIVRKGIDAVRNDRGIWYQVIAEGDGDMLGEGERVMFDYTCSLLDGTVRYDSDSDGPMTVVIGKSDIPSGLDSGLRLLKRGDEAILIIPSNLAYGLVGDGRRIPSRATLVYHVKLNHDLP